MISSPVEAICRTWGATDCGFITSRGYRAARRRPPSARAFRNELLLRVVHRIYAQNYVVYRVRKMQQAMRGAGWDIGRDQIARLMKEAGLHRGRRGRKPVTTRASSAPDTRPDHVERLLVAQRRHQSWVADITYVKFLSGVCYTAFVTDVYTRKIVGWAVPASLHTVGLPLLARKHALLNIGASRDRQGSIHHIDRGSQYTSPAHYDALIAADVRASVGTVGDCYDNALAETVNGLYKAEHIQAQRVWKSTEAVELATVGWVHWWNTTRLHEGLGYATPVETETAFTHNHDAAFGGF